MEEIRGEQTGSRIVWAKGKQENGRQRGRVAVPVAPAQILGGQRLADTDPSYRSTDNPHPILLDKAQNQALHRCTALRKYTRTDRIAPELLPTNIIDKSSLKRTPAQSQTIEVEGTSSNGCASDHHYA